ncbi:hypothetical protein [Streptomonospora salina]|uniref:Holin n=1 Tax=Streptomonospora salina TaxID=104205 RepID=A0A841EKL7_9ACTN|nr:hypothetical protein [Streptomonospora salina]MBB6001328.1 hypothetical protein [Streptomonospora salina]
MAMVTSIVRTVVPYVVGVVLVLAARVGIDLPPEALTEVTTPVVAAAVAAVYYGAARAAEEYLPERWARLGKVMLASGRSPTYSTDAEMSEQIRGMVRDEVQKRQPDVP